MGKKKNLKVAQLESKETNGLSMSPFAGASRWEA